MGVARRVHKLAASSRWPIAEECLELWANPVIAVRAGLLAVYRNPTVRDLPDARVTGGAPHMAATCSGFAHR